MNKAKLKLHWRKWYVKATVVTVVVVALLAVVWFVALKPTYTADEVTKKMGNYLERCYGLEAWRFRVLTTPHYIPYRKSWLISTAETRPDGFVITWLFDERTGTIASSNPCWDR